MNTITPEQAEIEIAKNYPGIYGIRGPELVPFSKDERRPMEWLWPGKIAMGKLTLLVGEPGVGKGLVAADLAARVSRGSPWPGCDTESGKVGGVAFLQAEDDPNDQMPDRLTTAGADLDRVLKFSWSGATKCNLDEKAGLGDRNNEAYWLDERALARHEVRLVVIDPLSAYMGEIDGNQNSQVRAQLKLLAQRAAAARVAIVAIAHLNKQVSAAAVNRVMGATSFVSTARSVWSVVRDPEHSEQRLMLPLKSNISGSSEGMLFRFAKVEGSHAPKLEWGDAPVTTTFEAVSGRRVKLAEREYWDNVNFIAERLREELSLGPRQRSELEIDLPGTDQQQYRAAEKLGIVKVKEGFDGGWLWMLPEHFGAWEAGRVEREEERKRQKRRKLEKRKRRRERMEIEDRP